MMDLWVRCYISVDTLVDSETKQDTSFVIICSLYTYTLIKHWKANTIFLVFGLIRPWFEPTIFTIQGEHVDHSTSEVVWDIEERIFEASNPKTSDA